MARTLKVGGHAVETKPLLSDAEEGSETRQTANSAMELKLFEVDNGTCPYLDGRQWRSHIFLALNLDAPIYEILLNRGFRRSGTAFYKNSCVDCKMCVPIRIAVNTFRPSKSQKRTIRKNRETTTTLHRIGYDESGFDLYKRYTSNRFGTEMTEEDYREILTESPIETKLLKYHHNSRLIGIGWIDVLPRSLSSVYFAFEPEYSDRRLGVYSILREIELARSLNKEFLHLGFWVRGCPSMEYKKQYKPHQLLLNGEWIQC